MQWLIWLLFLSTTIPNILGLRIRPQPIIEYDSSPPGSSRSTFRRYQPEVENNDESKSFQQQQPPHLRKRIFASGFYVEPSTTSNLYDDEDEDNNNYNNERVRSIIKPAPLKTENNYNINKKINSSNNNKYTRDNVENAKNEYEYNNESEGGDDYPTTTEEYYESSTNNPKYPSIPAALRRNFAKLTAETTTDPPSLQHHEYDDSDNEGDDLKKNNKSGRRRKIKRPTKLKLTTPKSKSSEDDLGIPENMDSKKSSGDKNLAVEIKSDDGKYALIDKFFDQNDLRAPGVITYSQSNDFSHDNEKTLGNVQKNDIWLSDGHLLVLKGGNLDSSAKETWKPIDAYVRDKKPPLRIPLNSNNPPPFPVFVNKSGPPVFIGDQPPPPFGYPPPHFFGNNGSFDPSQLPPPGLVPLYPNGTLPDYFGPPPFGLPGRNDSLPPPGYPYPGPPGGPGVYDRYPPPPPPNRHNNGSYPPPPFFPYPPPPPGYNGSLNGGLPPPGFYPFGLNGPPPPGFNPGNFTGGPPGNGFPLAPPVVLNPHDNETDDPSIFLPPPYDFDYHEDNTTLVPPGPFAPGLVVPPPKDFYTVYNRTDNSIDETDNELITENPMITTLSPNYFVPATSFRPKKRPQRPNDKKPKFPLTVRPDTTSLDEIFPIETTPNYPSLYPETPKPMKKRKQRPGKFNKGLFNTKYNGGESEQNSFEEVPDTDAPAIVLPDPASKAQAQHNHDINNEIIMTQIPQIITTQKPLNYVYVRGQLKTLEEIAAEQEDEPHFYLSTPRPPFDERGYPTRVLDEHEPTYIIQYPGLGPAQPNLFSGGNAGGGKQLLPPTYKPIYNNNPQQNPIYNTYQIVEEEEPSGEDEEDHESNEIKRPDPPTTPPPPRIIISYPQLPQKTSTPISIHHGSRQEPIYNNHINNNVDAINNRPTPPHHTNHISGGDREQQGHHHIIYGPEGFPQHQVVPVGPNYFTTTSNYPPAGNNRQQPQIIPQKPQHQQPFPYNNKNNSPISSVSYNSGSSSIDKKPSLPPPSPLNNHQHPLGFRPAFAPPQQSYPHQQQQHQQQQQQHQNNRQQSGRVLFPGQQINQYINPLFNARTPSIFQQGFYAPISQFHQNGGLGPFAPYFPSNNQGSGFQPLIQINRSPSQEQQQQVYSQHQQSHKQQQQPQSYHFQQQEQQHNQRLRNPQNSDRGYNSQLTGFIQSQPIPLHRDIIVNYREPLPQYNTESETITIRSIGKAGPSIGPAGSILNGKLLSSSKSPTEIENGNFYSFQRGGPGGFSYKIRL